MTQRWQRALLGASAGGVLALVVLWPTLLSLVRAWQSNQAYQYAWFVVPMVVYMLVWHDRQAMLAASPSPGYAGVAVAIFAAIGWGLADLINVAVGRQLAFILALQGIAMAAMGWRAYWRLAPILGLLFLTVPSGDVLQPALRILTVKMIEAFAVIANLPHTVDGFGIVIGKSEYTVIDECAGLAHFMLATFLGASFGLMLYRSVMSILALTLFGSVIGILSNGLRVNAIVLIDWVRSTQMPLSAHGNIQWVALLVALGILFFVLNKLAINAPQTSPVIQSTGPTTLPRQLAPAIAGLAVLLIAGTVIVLTSSAPQQTPSTQTQTLPENLAGWELATPPVSWTAMPDQLTQSLNLTYRRNGQDLGIVIIEALAPAAKLLASVLAPGGNNLWHQANIQEQSSCTPSGCITLLHSTWKNAKTEAIRHVYYTYRLGSLTTTSKLRWRAWRGWARLTGDPNRPQLIGFTLDGTANTPSIDDLAHAFSQLQTALSVIPPQALY